MCLLLVAVDAVPDRPRLLLGNRDEFHGRASAAAAPWRDEPGVYGGRDLEAGGSWLALHRNGRFAAVTNVRLAVPQRGPRSRGDLVRGFVAGAAPAHAWVDELARQRGDYAPFNLVVGDRESVWCLESPTGRVQRLTPGLHMISNGPLDAPWPKMQRLRAGFEALLNSGRVDVAAMLDLLLDEQRPEDAALPATGVSLEIERALSAVFVRGERYGTRASTLAWSDGDGRIGLVERSFGPNGVALGEVALKA